MPELDSTDLDELFKRPKKRTRVAMHFIDATPVEDDVVTVEGWLTFYDEREKSWKPLRGKLHFYLDGREIGDSESNNYGTFSFTFPAPPRGDHELEVRFKGKPDFEPSYKKMGFRVLEREEKSRIGRIARDAFLLIVFFIFVLILSLFFAKIMR